MALVQHNAAPVDLVGQRGGEVAVARHLVRRKPHVERVGVGEHAAQPRALRLAPGVQLDDPQGRAPLPQLRLPRGQHAEGGDDEVRAADVEVELQVREQRDCECVRQPEIGESELY